MYQTVGCKLYGLGVYGREIKKVHEIAAKTMYRIRENDLLINRIWAQKGSAGIVPKHLDGAVVTNDFPVVEFDLTKVFPPYIAWYVKYQDFWDECRSHSHGTSGRERLKPKELPNITFPLPPLNEQQRVAAILDRLMERIDEARRQREAAVSEGEILLGSHSSKIFENGYPVLPMDENICEIKGGIQKSQKRIPQKNPVRYITVAHVQRNFIDTSDPRFFEVSDEELEKWRLLPGDVLVIEGNGSIEQIGRTALFRGEIPECVHQNHVIRIRPNQELVDPEYLNLYLNSPCGQMQMLERSRTTSGLYNLSVGRIKTIKIPVPLKSVQLNIVNHLNLLQARITSLKSLQSEIEQDLEALIPSLLQKAFAGEL